MSGELPAVFAPSLLADPMFWSACGKIIFLNLLLSGDNALVIALATRPLPRHQQKWGRILGAAGAVVLRIVFVLLLARVLEWPYLQFIGGLALLWIAFDLVRPENEGDAKFREAGSIWHAIAIIIVADVVMSFDNVLAISAASKGQRHAEWLVVFGLALSIPLVVWGSELLGKLMARFRWIVWLGGGVLGHVAVEMAIKDNCTKQWLGETTRTNAEHFLPYFFGAALLLLGWWLHKKHSAPANVPSDPKQTETKP